MGTMQQPWLEVTCEPEDTTFRDEGGSLNYLCVFFVLRGEVPARLQGRQDVPVELSLEYEDGSPVACAPSKPALRLLGSAGSGKPKEGVAACDCRARRGSVRYKILKLSRNHDGRRFRVRVSLAGAPEVQSAATRATLVLSKRKWLKAEERTPENEKREQVEVRAEQENEVLARMARSEEAKADAGAPLRAAARLEPLEPLYPRHVSQEAVKREEEEAPRRNPARGIKRERDEAAGEGRRKSARGGDADRLVSSDFAKVLGALKRLEGQIEFYNGAVAEAKERLDAVELENHELRGRVEALEGALAVSQGTKRKVNPLVQLGAPLPLPRAHSLIGDDEVDPGYDLGESLQNIFSVPRGQIGLESL